MPTAKSTLSLIALMPAAAAPPSAQDVGGSRGEASVRMSIHGARQTDQRTLQNGMSFNMLDNPTGRTFFMNPLAAAEIVVEAGSGGSAEYSTGGAQVNIISRDGANQFSGFVLRCRNGTRPAGEQPLCRPPGPQNLKSVNSVRSIYDFNAVDRRTGAARQAVVHHRAPPERPPYAHREPVSRFQSLGLDIHAGFEPAR